MEGCFVEDDEGRLGEFWEQAFLEPLIEEIGIACSFKEQRSNQVIQHMGAPMRLVRGCWADAR
jgi:hypothetical protein